MESVYLKTTVVGHLAGRLHPDLPVQSRQMVTRQWWRTARLRYRLLASELVLMECRGGDSIAASERLDILQGIELLVVEEETRELAAQLLAHGAVPPTEPRDATHIALAAVHGVVFLVTWNFKHIMNPSTQHLIDAVCRACGYEPSTICTPEQLIESYDDP